MPFGAVPLASISFYIALRDLLEIPTCQLVASASILANGFSGIPNRFSEAVKGGENPVNLQEVYRWQQINSSVQEAHLERHMDDKFWEMWGRTEEKLWTSAHCEDSKWRPGRKLYLQDLAETWFVQPVVRLEDGHAGELGTGNLLMANVLIQQAVLRHLSLQKGLKPQMLKLIRKSKGMVSREYVGASLEDMLDAYDERVRKDWMASPFVKTADVFSIHQERERWQWNVGFSFILLVHAVSPIVKHVQKARHIPLKKLVPIAVHCVLDMILLVATLVGASVAAMAHDTGATMNALVSILSTITKLLVDLLDSQDSLFRAAEMVASIVISKKGMFVMDRLQNTVAPTLMISPTGLARIAAGVLGFCLVSLTVTQVSCPEDVRVTLTTKLNVAVAGPLHLLATETDAEAIKMSKAIFLQMVFRTLLLITIAGASWHPVDRSHAAYFYGLVFNAPLEVQRLQSIWVVVTIGHVLSGLFALEAVRSSIPSQDLRSNLIEASNYGSLDSISKIPGDAQV